MRMQPPPPPTHTHTHTRAARGLNRDLSAEFWSSFAWTPTLHTHRVIDVWSLLWGRGRRRRRKNSSRNAAVVGLVGAKRGCTPKEQENAAGQACKAILFPVSQDNMSMSIYLFFLFIYLWGGGGGGGGDSGRQSVPNVQSSQMILLKTTGAGILREIWHLKSPCN